MAIKEEVALTIPPVHFTMHEDTTLLLKNADLLANINVDSAKNLDIVSIINPQGTLVNNNNSTWSFTPSKYFSGSLILDCIISDGINKTVQPIKIEVLQLNQFLDNPEVELFIQDDGTFLISTQQLIENATDIEGDNLDIISMTTPQGTFENKQDGTWKFRPNAEYMSAIDLSFVVSDGHAQVHQNLLITANMPVYMPEIDVLMNENEAYTFTTEDLLQSSDVDGDLLSIVALDDTTDGQLINNGNGTWTYLPPENYVGPLELQFGITDNRGAMVDQSLSIYTISGSNKNIEQKVLHIEENGAIIINKNDLIPADLMEKCNLLTISNLASTQGKITEFGSKQEMKWIFMPNNNFSDVIDLHYIIDDGQSQTTHFASIEIEPD